MYSVSLSPRFEHDVKACAKRHWNMVALKNTMADLLKSDEEALSRRYKDHALVGRWQGYRAIRVDSALSLAKDQWVLMHKLYDRDLAFVRTGTYEEVYGK